MKTVNLLLSGAFLLSGLSVSAQSVTDSQSARQGLLHEHAFGCGSHDLMKCMDHHQPGFMRAADEMLKDLISSTPVGNQRNVVYEIPVVFHIVYNNEDENLADEVIEDQLQVLNDCFRRTNGDAINTRPEFLNYVGDASISFVLADTDPDGMPTDGIVRVQSSVEYFGGTLPYGPGQNAQIAQWVNDSLFYNFMRLANSDLGGSEPWNPSSYLNIYVGDLRIFEPQFNNFEELVFFGIATPPVGHFNWPDDPFIGVSNFQEGVFMHYINIGSNNPNNFPSPYNQFNGVTNTGKMLVHEVGHYLGLRHIWGDGNCSIDDFITDTPNAASGSTWNCNQTANSCIDDIDGLNLPDMVENYMDYSSGNCQNAFTIGQIDLMQSVLNDYRPDLAQQIFVGLNESRAFGDITIYPNPNKGFFILDLQEVIPVSDIRISTITGVEAWHGNFVLSDRIELDVNLSPGMYVLHLEDEYGNIHLERFVVN